MLYQPDIQNKNIGSSKGSCGRKKAQCWKVKGKVKCTLVQALRLCTGRTAYRGSRGITLPFHDHATRRCEGSASRPGRFLPGKDPVPIVQEAGWAPGPVWISAENLAHTGIRSPDRPSRSVIAIPTTLPGPLTYAAFLHFKPFIQVIYGLYQVTNEQFTIIVVSTAFIYRVIYRVFFLTRECMS